MVLGCNFGFYCLWWATRFSRSTCFSLVSHATQLSINSKPQNTCHIICFIFVLSYLWFLLFSTHSAGSVSLSSPSLSPHPTPPLSLFSYSFTILSYPIPSPSLLCCPIFSCFAFPFAPPRYHPFPSLMLLHLSPEPPINLNFNLAIVVFRWLI